MTGGTPSRVRTGRPEPSVTIRYPNRYDPEGWEEDRLRNSRTPKPAQSTLLGVDPSTSESVEPKSPEGRSQKTVKVTVPE